MSDPDETDMLAAEYVLGTLDADERASVASRLGADAELARAVRAWETRLAPLVDRVPDVAPPEGAYGRIAARLFGSASAGLVGAEVAVLARRVRRWRSATAAFALLAASLLAWVAVRGPSTPTDQRRFTAVLQRDAGAPAMLVEVDLAARRLTVRPLATVAPAGHAYELWIVAPGIGAPRSLGLVPASGEARDSLASFDEPSIADATYAVTLEPAGGSPTGRPTTAPLLTGKLLGSPP